MKSCYKFRTRTDAGPWHEFMFKIVRMVLSSLQYASRSVVGGTWHGNNTDQPFSGANADCRVEYDLWGEGGNLNSDITNNTERNIYVYLPECFVITNGYSNDYYRDEEVQVGAKRVRSPKVVCIPPHTTKSLQCKYAINNGLFADCNFDMFPKNSLHL